jgi:hypothetical protein
VKQLHLGVIDTEMSAAEVHSLAPKFLNVTTITDKFSLKLVQSHLLQISNAFREFRQEVLIQSMLSHPSFVNLLAICMNPFCLIMECVPHGTLYEVTAIPQITTLCSFLNAPSSLTPLVPLSLLAFLPGVPKFIVLGFT